MTTGKDSPDSFDHHFVVTTCRKRLWVRIQRLREPIKAGFPSSGDIHADFWWSKTCVMEGDAGAIGNVIQTTGDRSRSSWRSYGFPCVRALQKLLLP